MYFLDAKERRIDRVKEGIVVDLPIKTDLSSLPIEEAVSEVEKTLDSIVKNVKVGKKPIIFDFNVEFEGENEDFAALADLIVSIFSRWNTDKTKRRECEYRFDAPYQLIKFMYYPSGWLKDMINYECKVNRFVVHIHTANNEFCYRMFDDVNLDKEEVLPYAK